MALFIQHFFYYIIVYTQAVNYVHYNNAATVLWLHGKIGLLYNCPFIAAWLKLHLHMAIKTVNKYDIRCNHCGDIKIFGIVTIHTKTIAAGYHG